MNTFITTAEKVGAAVIQVKDINAACDYISEKATGTLLLPHQTSLERIGLAEILRQQSDVLVAFDKKQAALAAAGVTGANFGIADTGTVVLESTDEATRLASTLPERHFVLLDPDKIVPDGIAAATHLRALHQRDARNFIAYITGPSRTADIERVLTIGVHGPKQLHILLVPGLSSDPLEN
jgi:L-lactate dehydrogenase complex protein LldG